MRVAKLSNGKIVLLLKHEAAVAFSALPGWSLVARPIQAPVTQQTCWWVQSTSVVWILDVDQIPVTVLDVDQIPVTVLDVDTVPALDVDVDTVPAQILDVDTVPAQILDVDTVPVPVVDTAPV